MGSRSIVAALAMVLPAGLTACDDPTAPPPPPPANAAAAPDRKSVV